MAFLDFLFPELTFLLMFCANPNKDTNAQHMTSCLYILYFWEPFEGVNVTDFKTEQNNTVCSKRSRIGLFLSYLEKYT